MPNHIELSIGILKMLYYQFQSKAIESFLVTAILWIYLMNLEEIQVYNAIF